MEKLRKYLAQEEGYETYYTDDGFCAYVYDGDEFYIAHLYAEKGKSYSFYKEVTELAKKVGCKHITANLDLNDSNIETYTKKVLIQLGHGAKIVNVTNKRITVLKQLY
jgi:hypothetical protein